MHETKPPLVRNFVVFRLNETFFFYIPMTCFNTNLIRIDYLVIPVWTFSDSEQSFFVYTRVYILPGIFVTVISKRRGYKKYGAGKFISLLRSFYVWMKSIFLTKTGFRRSI